MLIKWSRMFLLAMLDMIAIHLGYIVCILLRFEFHYESLEFIHYLSLYLDHTVMITVIKIVIFALFGLYNSLWKYAGSQEIVKVSAAAITASMGVVFYLSMIQASLPRSINILTCLTDILLIGFIRIGYRFIRDLKNSAPYIVSHEAATRVMVIGAGDAGASMIKEMKLHPEYRKVPVIAIDDNAAKHHVRVAGVRVAGGRDKIALMAAKHSVDEIIIAIPSAAKKELNAITHECNQTKCKLKILPGIIDIINDKVSINELRDVSIEDLLGREPVTLNQAEVSEYLNGKIALVTGGGGSIGSELCRQIAKFGPRKLIAVDIYENNLFDLESEIRMLFPALAFEAVVCSVRNPLRMRQVFQKYRPHVVFHAAAHKHVPLMEHNPKEAVLNNIGGTRTLVDLSAEFLAEKFVLISTDKAVNPTNVMGTTKRIAEMIVQAKSRDNTRTQFSAVRFGNVLGSNGSVVPLFRKQIERGGPVTVTDPDVIRYFMTIPEACQLVIQAGALAEGGEIFILDMGDPVRILNLAENIIRLSGLRPYDDIEIQFTGLRPGEKRFEELLLDEEGIRKTTHNKIYVGKPLSIDQGMLQEQLDHLLSLVDGSDENIKAYLQEVVPNYSPAANGHIIQ